MNRSLLKTAAVTMVWRMIEKLREPQSFGKTGQMLGIDRYIFA